MSIQGWFPLTVFISLLFKELLGDFSSTTIQRYQFWGALPCLWSSSHKHIWSLGKPQPWLYGFLYSKFGFGVQNEAAAAVKLLQSCPTLCNPIDSSPPGSALPGILQARTLEWDAISFFNAWKWKVKVKSLSCVQLFATPWTAAHQAPPSMGFSRQEYRSGFHCLLWKWNRAKAKRVLPREHTHHSKHPLLATQEKTLHKDITSWPIPKTDWLYSLQPKMEKLYTVNKNKTTSWLSLRSYTPYCQIRLKLKEVWKNH